MVLKRIKEKPRIDWWRGRTRANTAAGWLSLGAGALTAYAIVHYGLLSDFLLSAVLGFWALAYLTVFYFVVLRKAELKAWAFAGIAAMAALYWLFVLAALALTAS